MRYLMLMLLAFSACKPQPKYTWRDRCDVEQQERIFLACLQSAQHMGGAAAPGNDSDEVVEACRAAAANIACLRVLKCEQCAMPAVHAEVIAGEARAWCDQHTPWSGHFEFCGDQCRALITGGARAALRKDR